MTPRTILIYAGQELMGDGFIKLPFARALRAAHPGAHMTWLAGKGRTVFAHELAPLVHGVLDAVIEDADIGSKTGELIGARPLAGQGFDLVIDTQSRVLTTLIVRRLEHARFISPTANFWFSNARPPRGYEKPPHLHHRLFDIAALAIGHAVKDPGPQPLPAAFRAEAARLLPGEPPPGGPTYVGFAPGAGNRQKCWPLDGYVALAQRQAARNRVPVFILGPDEGEWHATLAAAVPGARFPNQDSGTTISPILTLALAGRLAAAVTGDGGAGHILAEGGAPMVSLWGPTDVAKFHPMARRLKIVRAQSYGGDTMDRIPVDGVDAALDALLADQTLDDKPVVVSRVFG
jgi:ADP-heptose:LPS heptosyltransferase